MSGLSKQYPDLNAGTSSMMESSMMEGDGFYTPDTVNSVPGAAVAPWPDKTEPSQLCRVCANPNDYLIPIFNGEGVEHNLSMKIERHLPIEVRESDSLPVQICYQCATTLMAWHDLVTTCVEADKKLRELQEREEEDDEDDKTVQFYEAPSMDSDTGEEPVQPSTSTTVAKTKVSSSPPATRKSLASKRLKRRTPPTRLSQRSPSKLLQPAKPKEDSERCGTLASHNSAKPAETSISYQHQVAGRNVRTQYRSVDYRALYARLVSLDNNEKDTHECKDCGKQFRVRSQLRAHSRTHTGERPFTCHVCGKQFRTNVALKRHIREVHDRVRNSVCDICGSRFLNNKAASEHRRIHTGERPYVCDTCGKAFRTSAGLLIHNKFHGDVFPFSCTHCDKKFRIRGHLVAHLRIHTGEKPYRCDVCERCFSQSSCLKNHRLIHFDVRQFVCTLCGLAFKQRRSLKNHVITHHKPVI